VYILQLTSNSTAISIKSIRVADTSAGVVGSRDKRLFVQRDDRLWAFHNLLPDGQDYLEHDALYLPHDVTALSSLNVSDLYVDARDGVLYYVDSSRSVVMQCQPDSAPHVWWKPDFITDIAPDNRCYLSGLAVVNQAPRYATAAARSNTPNGWGAALDYGGVLIDMKDNRVVVDGLSIPCSPRWYADQLWLLNSGRGEFGFIDRKVGRFESVLFGPGYMRRLAFHQQYAVIALIYRAIFTRSKRKPINRCMAGWRGNCIALNSMMRWPTT
jgi:uncharacterized protein (TIGR03032 family)